MCPPFRTVVRWKAETSRGEFPPALPRGRESCRHRLLTLRNLQRSTARNPPGAQLIRPRKISPRWLTRQAVRGPLRNTGRRTAQSVVHLCVAHGCPLLLSGSIPQSISPKRATPRDELPSACRSSARWALQLARGGRLESISTKQANGSALRQLGRAFEPCGLPDLPGLHFIWPTRLSTARHSAAMKNPICFRPPPALRE
jgi:hypothetical protein